MRRAFEDWLAEGPLAFLMLVGACLLSIQAVATVVYYLLYTGLAIALMLGVLVAVVVLSNWSRPPGNS